MSQKKDIQEYIKQNLEGGYSKKRIQEDLLKSGDHPAYRLKNVFTVGDEK